MNFRPRKQQKHADDACLKQYNLSICLVCGCVLCRYVCCYLHLQLAQFSLEVGCVLSRTHLLVKVQLCIQ